MFRRKTLYSIKKIDERIAELNEQINAELAIEDRVLENVSKYYAEGVKEKAPEEPPKELVSTIERATKILQLQPSEVKMFDARIRGDLLINPCGIPSHSPESHCEFIAGSMVCHKWKSGTASTSCLTNPSSGKNDINAKCSAYGYGQTGTSYAMVRAYAWFEVNPFYSKPSFVTIHPKILFNGFHVQQNSGNVSLYAIAKGYQYQYNWGGADQLVLNESGTGMSRFDNPKWLTFQMPVGPDPFHVLVYIRLIARAQGSGSMADIDFSTGAGNTIRIVYVNTWD
jgi:hypothetical protein